MGDSDYTTNERILLDNFKQLPAIVCVQQTANKKQVTEKNLYKSNWDSMGIKVGSITNKITAMFDVLAGLDRDDGEKIKEINYRIMCGQLYQQSNLDSAKGCIYKPMPKYWYDYAKCENDDDRQLCAHNKPYFMIYRYEDIRKKYRDYIQKNNINSIKKFATKLDDLLIKNNLTDDEKIFIKNYYKYMPVSIAPSVVNRVCWHIEKEIDKHNVELKNKNLNYNIYKNKKKYKKSDIEKITTIIDDYCLGIYKYNISDDKEKNAKKILVNEFKKRMTNYLPIDKILNILIDMCETNKKYKTVLWDLFGEEFVERVGETNDYTQ